MNAVGTRAECFHSFFEFCQTFTSVSITGKKQSTCFLFLLENTATKKGRPLVTDFDHQNVNSLF